MIEWRAVAAYCSDACRQRAERDRRRAAERDAFVEHVSWRVLVERDGPACYLCGDAVDPDDYEIREGRDGREAFVAGPLYPTVDHVIPLSRGGEHSYGNARLAHFLCNSTKGDRLAA